jgi:hypothetical protein
MVALICHGVKRFGEESRPVNTTITEKSFVKKKTNTDYQLM